MSALTGVPAVTVMPAAGQWGPDDCSRARQDIERKEREGEEWRRLERNELVTGALNTIAGFACGRLITKIIDPDGNLSSSRTDGTGDSSTYGISGAILFTIYIVICLIAVGCGIYYLFGKVDAAREAHDRIKQKIEGSSVSLEGTSSTAEALRANELGSRVIHNVRTSVLTRIISKWSSTQMFTVAVLLHHVYDWTPSSEDAPRNAWDALLWLNFIALVLLVAFYELPVRLCARYQLNINLHRLERVVDVGTGALAWLLAVFCMEALEITAAHQTMTPENLKNMHYYNSAYHGMPITLRAVVCLGTFFATGVVLFSLQQIAKRTDNERRLCFRRCHPDDDYVRKATESDLEKRPREKLKRDLAGKCYCLGQHGHRILETTQRTFTNISSMALQRLIMGLITFSNYDVADDFAFKGKSASETVVDLADKFIGPSPESEPEPEPEPNSDDSSSGSWSVEENITETISPLLAACERALSTNNATLLYDSIRSTRHGLSVDGKVVKDADPEPEPLPEPEPEPEPLPELDEASKVSVLKSSTWKDCKGNSQELECSVLPAFASPTGGPSWVAAQCDDTVALVCDEHTGPCDKPSLFNTGSMKMPYCKETPLYGDSILLAMFAVLCFVVALWILRAGERRLRKRLNAAVAQTESQILRHKEPLANPVIDQMKDRAMLNRPSFSAAGYQPIIVQTHYDCMAMMTQQKRSFCQWIVNKTWWDVTYNIMKQLELLSYYYTMAFIFTCIAAATPLILYDRSLLKTMCCGNNNDRAVQGLRRGLLLRSVSREQRTEYSGVSDSEGDDLVPSNMKMPSADQGMLSGPTADESNDKDKQHQELQQLRQRNRRLEERVAQLEQELATGGQVAATSSARDASRDSV